MPRIRTFIAVEMSPRVVARVGDLIDKLRVAAAEINWVRPQQNLGRVVVHFRIKRDGTIAEPQIYESSRNQAVDLLASGAIKRSEPFPPLPVEFGGDYLGIYLCFGLGSSCPGQKEG